jgi:hypothetical protein
MCPCETTSLRQSVDLSPIGHIGRYPFNPNIQSGGDGVRSRLQFVPVPAADRYIRAGIRKCPGHRSAQTFAASCN